MRRLLLLLLLSAMAIPCLSGLTVERGNMRITLHETSSRFTISYHVSGDEWEPLLFEQDPRTTALDILAGNRVIRMGDGGSFRQVAEETERGARYVFTSSTLEVVQDFAFIRGVSATEMDAVQMTVTVTNVGEIPSAVGVRFLLDTYLGESDNTHFTSPSQDQITREQRWDAETLDQYIVSPALDQMFALQLMLRDSAITPIESAVVANWKRLIDSNWGFEVNTTRNFNRLPYSINDSAIMVTYPTVLLESDESYEVVTQFGNSSPDGYLGPDESLVRPVASSETPSVLTPTSPTEEETQPTLAQIVADLIAVIDEIDQLLAAETVTVEDVARVSAQLQALIEIVSRR